MGKAVEKVPLNPDFCSMQTKLSLKRKTLNRKVTSNSLTNTISLAKQIPTQGKARSTAIIFTFFSIFGHATFRDKVMLILGCFFALTNGMCWPLHIYIIATYAQKISGFLTASHDIHEMKESLSSMLQEEHLNNTPKYQCDHDRNLTEGLSNICNISDMIQETRAGMTPEDDFVAHIWEFTYPAAGIAIVQIATGYLFILILNSSAERIIFRLRQLFMRSVLRQDMVWFDSKGQGELIAHVMRSMDLIQMSLGEKLGTFLLCISEVTVSLTFCFWSGWKLTLVLACLYPILVIIAKLNLKFQNKMSKLTRAINAEFAGLLQEVFVAIRTVVSFGGEDTEKKRVENRLRMARQMNGRQNIASGMNFSFIFVITQGFISLGFWLGIRLMESDYSVQNVLVINTMTLMAGIFIRMAVPLMELLASGFTAAHDIIGMIERKPVIDNTASEGITRPELEGNIEFHHVHFWYPSSPGEKKILRGLNLRINAGETVALVGPSGSGKSTVIQLLQRFYDPQKGKVKVDGTNLYEYNLGWFRKNVGIVSQEPCLFEATIRENIRYGNEEATEEDIIRAAKEANAHEFITTKLPEKYDTMVGSQGSQMSGGERQRIAIARALVRNPRILLLDEATSALDNESQVIVQESLEKARQGRTTLVIAHRLATIRQADQIVVIKGGKVVEKGNHDELQERDGVYAQLLSSQHGPQECIMPVADFEDYDSEEDEEERGETEDDDDDDATLEDFLNSITPTQDTDEARKHAEMRRSFWKVLQLCKNDWAIVVTGIFCYILFALSHPSRSFVMGNIANVVVVKSLHATRWAVFWPASYIIVGFLSFIVISLRTVIQTKVEEGLLYRIRQKCFSSIMKQEIGWFDKPEQNVGNLCSLFTIDAENVKKIPGAMLGTWCYATVAFIMLFVFSLVINWELALVTSVAAMFVVICHYLQGKITQGALLGLLKTEEKANNIAIEIIRNIKTIMSLHIQEIAYRHYTTALGAPRSIFSSQIQLRAIISGFSEGIILLGLTTGLSYASFLMYEDRATFKDYQIIACMLIVNLMEVSHALASAPSYSKACISAHKLLQVIKRKPEIDRSHSTGIQLPKRFRPRVQFRDVTFSYPLRPNETVLNNLNLIVEDGETVAFVGKSGCGKSTTIQLLQRLYDPSSGNVALDGCDLRALNVPALRSIIGLVSQEPTLFNRSIADNIKYGVNDREVCMHEVIDAARQANIHEFIINLRSGYETRIGQKGVLLSGGQKQRVAIARALIKNPHILILDEATSALDTESERIVQEALDKASEGRTCIVIAHRLSTIQNADRIAVFDRGQVVELGTQDELIENKGIFFEMLQLQMGQRRRLSRPLLDLHQTMSSFA